MFEVNATVKYFKDVDIYKITFIDFIGIKTEPPHIYLKPSQVPDKFKDQEQIFQIGDLVDRVYHTDDGNYYGGAEKNHREYYGKIIDVKEKYSHKVNEPKQYIYFTDIWHRDRSNGIEQNRLQLSLNPPVD